MRLFRRLWLAPLLAVACTNGDLEPDVDDESELHPYGSLGNDHGVVRFEFYPSIIAPDDLLEGTATVEITMRYGECLIGFYQTNPHYRQHGVDGEQVFLGVGNDLCATGDPELAECVDVQVQQEVDVAYQLTVETTITGPLEGRQLRFGPLPTADLTQCDGPLPFPIAEIHSNGSARGLDAAGEALWVTQYADPIAATTDQREPIRIQAIPPR
ncbi:MAG: hypothetical protein AAF799_13820 [Myxococcota bacterium]